MITSKYLEKYLNLVLKMLDTLSEDIAVEATDLINTDQKCEIAIQLFESKMPEEKFIEEIRKL